jgi:hypothetical protein
MISIHYAVLGLPVVSMISSVELMAYCQSDTTEHLHRQIGTPDPIRGPRSRTVLEIPLGKSGRSFRVRP